MSLQIFCQKWKSTICFYKRKSKLKVCTKPFLLLSTESADIPCDEDGSVVIMWPTIASCISTTSGQTPSADEDLQMWLKALKKASMWALTLISHAIALMSTATINSVGIHSFCTLWCTALILAGSFCISRSVWFLDVSLYGFVFLQLLCI